MNFGYGTLRAGDDFVGTGGEHEVDAIFAVGFHGGGEVEGGELDVSQAITGLGGGIAIRGSAHRGVRSAFVVRVKDAANDGVVGNLFAMAVAVDENGGRELGGIGGAVVTIFSSASCGIPFRRLGLFG